LFCGRLLFLVGPKALNGISVVDGVSRRFVPTAKLGGKRIVFPVQSGTNEDLIDGAERALFEEQVNVKPGYMSSKGLYVNFEDPCVVEPIEYQNLQKHMRGDGILRELLKKFLERFVAQLIEMVLVV
jgi:hypothetical protein